MTVFLAVMFCATLFLLQHLHKKERAEILAYCLGKEKKHTATRHLSPHRVAIEKQRRIDR